MSDSPAAPRGIDPRGPRFAASLTTVLLAGALVLSLVGISTAQVGWFAYAPLSGQTYAPVLSWDATGDFGFVAGGSPWLIVWAPVWARVLDAGFLLTLVIALLFLWSVAWPRTAPWGALFRTVVQPRLSPPSELEDPRPPRFAQGVGLFVTTVGLVLHVLGVPWALPIAVAMAFVAAFLNAVFGLCLGCQLYLLLQRAGIVGRRRPATA
jgi:hypothetical protein